MLSMRQNEHQHDDIFKFGKEFDPDEIKIEKIQHNPNMDTKWLPTNKDHIYSTYEGGNAPSRSAKDRTRTRQRRVSTTLCATHVKQHSTFFGNTSELFHRALALLK